jgi:hypothetical protein
LLNRSQSGRTLGVVKDLFPCIGWGADPRTTLTVSWATTLPVRNPVVDFGGSRPLSRPRPVCPPLDQPDRLNRSRWLAAAPSTAPPRPQRPRSRLRFDCVVVSGCASPSRRGDAEKSGNPTNARRKSDNLPGAVERPWQTREGEGDTSGTSPRP